MSHLRKQQLACVLLIIIGFGISLVPFDGCGNLVFAAMFLGAAAGVLFKRPGLGFMFGFFVGPVLLAVFVVLLVYAADRWPAIDKLF
jgi:hypothetical protein